jgi:hypothetical protein
VLTLDGPAPRAFSARALLTPLVVLALYGLLLALFDPVPATVVAMVMLVGSALAYDLAPWMRRRRRTARLPQLVEQWCPAERAGARRRGAGLGLTTGPAGQEVVVADGFGFEAWLPGPCLGGLASLLVLDDAGPWGLLALDRDQRPLLTLPARDWVGRTGALASLAAAVSGWGIVVSEATKPRAPYADGRRLSRVTSSTLDVRGSLVSMFVNGVCTPLFWIVTGFGTDSLGLADCWWAVGAGLLLFRLGMRWRRVL